ncbi:MAG: Y-family DNA polymerase [Flavisolibacter sp.]|jgi:DNA polymerase V
MKAIVDCNSFYCSCERLFKPHLDQKPVVVLSNNDGCIISRTDEAKALGVGMAGPYFKAKDIIEQNGVAVFSSNYNLYGDLSRRVMQTLKGMLGESSVEVYSVDEAFLNLQEFTNSNLDQLAMDIRKTVEQWTGIKVSVGVAPTKTLAKLANYLAKKDKAITDCITVLDTQQKITEALKVTDVKNLWGVGTQYANKLKNFGICTAWDLYNLSEEWVRRYLGGVVGVRLIKELHGEESIVMEKELVNKKMITTTRMFGAPVASLSDIKEAVATYTSRAAEKLRRQQSAASIINVFVVPKDPLQTGRFRHGPSIGSHAILSTPSALTQDLIKPALQIAERIYEQGRSYKKAGVILSGLVPDDSIQANLFESPSKNIGRYLMEMMDNINFSMRNDVVKFASSGTKRNWKMRQEFHSPRYTTRWEEMYEVH